MIASCLMRLLFSSSHKVSFVTVASLREGMFDENNCHHARVHAGLSKQLLLPVSLGWLPLRHQVRGVTCVQHFLCKNDAFPMQPRALRYTTVPGVHYQDIVCYIWHSSLVPKRALACFVYGPLYQPLLAHIRELASCLAAGGAGLVVPAPVEIAGTTMCTIPDWEYAPRWEYTKGMNTPGKKKCATDCEADPVCTGATFLEYANPEGKTNCYFKAWAQPNAPAATPCFPGTKCTFRQLVSRA